MGFSKIGCQAVEDFEREEVFFLVDWWPYKGG